MARSSFTCESCGVRVTAREVEEGGAFFDGEHCYCAICVARLMQKVRTAQRGRRGKTVGVVFQEGLTGAVDRTPSWLLYTIVAEAALAAILFVILLIPTKVELPGRDAEVLEETRVKSLLTDARVALDESGQAEDALSILKRADNLAVGTVWSHMVKEKIKQVRKLCDKEAKEAFRELERQYNALMLRNEYDFTIAALDRFPEKYRDTTYWKVDISRFRKKAEFAKEADRAFMEILAKAVPLRRAQKYEEAIGLLRTFPAQYAATHAASRVAQAIDEIIGERDRWTEMQKREQERQATDLEKKKRQQEEAQRRAAEAQQRRIAAEKARLAEEEARKREEEARREQTPQPEPEPEPEKEPEKTAIKVKGEWEEVKLAPGHARKFPYFSPRAYFVALERGAKGDKLYVPYPHKGKVSGFGVQDLTKSVMVDTDADGKPDKQLPADGGVVVLKISFEEGKEIPCAVEIKREGGQLHYRRYGWMAGRFKGTSIYIIDENSNAKYNEVRKDAIVVGKAKGATVFGHLVEIKGEFYQVEVAEDGSNLRLRPVELSMGKLSLAKGFKARGKLNYVVVLGQVRGSKQVVSFEFSGRGKPVTVPAGDYRIYAGKVSGPDRAEILIYGGPKAKNFTVEAGETAEPKWGVPGVIEFKYTLHKDGTLEIESTDLMLYGQLGERYMRWGPKQWLPRVQVKNAAGKVIVDRNFGHSSDFDHYNRFEYSVGTNATVKVRIIGEPKFLGHCESKWK